MTDARTLDAGDRLDRAEHLVLDAMLLAELNQMEAAKGWESVPGNPPAGVV